MSTLAVESSSLWVRSSRHFLFPVDRAWQKDWKAGKHICRPARGTCFVILPCQRLPFLANSLWPPTRNWWRTLCSPGKGALPSHSLGSPLRQRVEQVASLGNLFWNFSHKLWVSTNLVQYCFFEVLLLKKFHFSLECEVMRYDLILEHLFHTWLTGEIPSLPFKLSCLWLLLEDVLICEGRTERGGS